MVNERNYMSNELYINLVVFAASRGLFFLLALNGKKRHLPCVEARFDPTVEIDRGRCARKGIISICRTCLLPRPPSKLVHQEPFIKYHFSVICFASQWIGIYRGN